MHEATTYSPYVFTIWCQIKYRYNFTPTLIHKCTKTCKLYECYGHEFKKRCVAVVLNTLYVNGLIWLRIEPSGRLL